jgi:hypothetical protein
MNAPALTLPRRSASGEPGPLEFDALRAAGIQALQASTGRRWTDHNLHDPGIMLLEALAYALSEQGFRLEAPLLELLSDARGHVDAEALGLHPAARALSCHAGTPHDLRRWLLDRVEGLHDVHCATVDGQPGLWQLHLQARPGALEQPLREAVIRAFADQRQLGEDLALPVHVVTPRLVKLQGHIGVAGARDPVDILADLFHHTALHLAGLPGRSVDRGDGDGPELTHPARPLPEPRPQRRPLDELMAALRRIEGVAEITQLALVPPPVGADDERRPLALVMPPTLEDLAQVQLHRRGAPLTPDLADALLSLRDLQQQAQQLPARPAPAPLRGREPDHSPYYSLAGHLPAFYEADRPVDKSAALRAYIALLEQPLAHAQAQLRLLPDLFACPPAAGGPARPSHAWALIDPDTIAGLEHLYTTDKRGDIVPTAYARHDAAEERRQRALDALLAMHGEVQALNTLRQYLGHLDDDVQQQMLREVKATFVQQLMTLHRDRGAGPDPRAPLSSARGLAQRLPLLLGLPPRPPRLAPLLSSAGIRGMNREPGAESLPAGLRRWTPGEAVLPAAIEPGSGLPNPLPLPMLRAAASPRRWQWDGTQVWLVADGVGQGWPMGSPAQAAARRDLLTRMHDASESVLVVDHVLLRPRLSEMLAGDVDWFCLRASVLMPDWGLRATLPGFQAFVVETLSHNAPAHVRVELVLLTPTAWLGLDRALHAWQATRAGNDDQAIDDAAAHVRRLLREAGA